MNLKNEKQKEKDPLQMKEYIKKMKKSKNPYNINISFNFNNPKKVISNQINKNFKINNYSLGQQLGSNKTYNRPNISKVLNPISKYRSTSLPKSRQFNKYQCYLENNNESTVNNRKKNKKSKPYDIETKSKSDFVSTGSILNMDFPGDDPLPQLAVKKLNRMKRYFLQKIGSMDITMTGNDHDEHQQSVDLKYPNQKYQHGSQKQKSQNQQNNKKQDDVMTEKLSEYRYENLISYENQNQNQKPEQSNGLQISLKQKEIFCQELSDAFPQVVIDSINSMSIKNQYLRNHSKFINQNIDFFHQSYQQKPHKKLKNNQLKNTPCDTFSLHTLKSKLLYNHSPQPKIKHKKQQSKQLKSNHQKSIKKISETTKMKEKIQHIQDLLLKNESSRSLLVNPHEKNINSSESSQLLMRNNKQKNPKKSYVIKTQIQLPNEIINEIKDFQQNQQKIESQRRKNGREQQVSFIVPENKKQKKQKINFEQFLMERSRQNENKQTKDLIQNYIDLLHENQEYAKNNGFQQKLPNDKSLLNQVSSVDEVHYLSSINTSRLESQVEQQFQIQKTLKHNHKDQESDNRLQSVNSYMYQDSNTSKISHQFDAYSPERMQKMQIDRKMRQDFIKKIVTSTLNANSAEEKQKKYNQNELLIHQTIDVQTPVKQHQKLSEQFNSLLGFIEKNLNYHSTDKKILEDLYEKLKNVSNIESLKNFLNSKQTLFESSQSASHHDQIDSSQSQKFSQVITPKKEINFVKPNNLHRRSYSTQKYSTKINENFTSSDDLNYWDLILVEEKLNKKYIEISHEKQKILFSIESDTTLSQLDCQNKINELNEWENQAKKQILLIKKQIKNGLERLKKLFHPVENNLNFKMKCFSQKTLGYKSAPQTERNIQKSQSKVKQPLRKKQIIKVQPKIEIDLNALLNQNKTQHNQKEKILISENVQQQDFQEKQVQRIELFRTNKKNNLHEKSPSSVDSQSISYELDEENKNTFDQVNNERQQFIDLLKIEKYKLGKFDDQEVNSNQSVKNQYVESQEKEKLKNISEYNPTQQDKIDICQFILLDLCIQLYQETLDLEDSHIKKGKYSNSGPNRIITDIFNFIKKEKKKPIKKGPKIGIHTELTTVKEFVQKMKVYIENLQEKSLQQTQKQNKKLIINRVNLPIGPTAAQILKTMRFQQHQVFQYRQDQTTIQASQTEGLNSLILPVHVFTDFEDKLQNQKQFIFDKYFDDQQKEKNRLAFLRNVTHVHHKAIFDSLNQMLDFQRPFGIWGKPFPWKKKNDKEKLLNEDELKISLKNSCSKVVECAMYMCGLMIDKQQSLLKNTTVSQSYIEEVKQDRMSKMIINDFLQNEGRFYFFDDEETEIMLQTSYVIWVLLLQEALKQIKSITQRTF